MKFCSIVGARPNFVKLAPISKEIRKKYKEVIIHTGQHYDQNMSDNLFKDMNIPIPNYTLNRKESSPGHQIGYMIADMEQILTTEQPDVVVVFGDTNSTLAGAIIASKMRIPVAHIESGCRSYDMSMHEEQNRVMVDHISKFLFASTSSAARILELENVYGDIYDYGDVTVDILNSMKIAPLQSDYMLMTIHRPVNADSFHSMDKILSAINELPEKIIFPVHPRTNKTLEKYKLKERYTHITYIDPVDYSTMISYLKSAKMIITDSGGIQKEAYILKTPCITLRNTTEWVETIDHGWNVLVPYLTKKDILNSIINYKKPSVYIDCFGSVGVSKRIIKCIGDNLNEGITN
jgi:UDP-N-acetylglucosamine 2-epimerase